MAVETEPSLSHKIEKITSGGQSRVPSLCSPSLSSCYLNLLSTLPLFSVAHLIALVNTRLHDCTGKKMEKVPPLQLLSPICFKKYVQSTAVQWTAALVSDNPGCIVSKSHVHSTRLIYKSSLISLTIFFVLLSSPSPALLHSLSRPLSQTHTGPRPRYTLWAWWTYTSQIRALRQSLEHPDTLGWAERLTDWLTLLDGRSELLFCPHWAETHFWLLQLWAFKEQEIAQKTNQTETTIIWFPAVLWNVIPPCGLSKFVIPNCHVVPFF